MDLNALVAAFAAHNWLACVLAVAVYLRFLFSDASKFPATWNPNLRPLFVGVAGDVVVTITAHDNGQTWGLAILTGVVGLIAGGFADGMIVAIFGSTAKAPSWARWLVGAVDGLVSGSGSGGSSAKREDVVTKAANDVAPFRTNQRRADTRLDRPLWLTRTVPRVVVGLGLATLLAYAVGASCQVSPATQAEIQAAEQLGACIEDVYANDSEKVPAVTPVQIAIDEGTTCGADVVNLVALFGSSMSAGKQAVAKAAQDNASAVHAAAAAHR